MWVRIVVPCQQNIVTVAIHTHNRFTALLDLSWTTRVSRHQKGKTNLDLLEQETVSGIVAVTSAGPYANNAWTK